MVPEKKRKTGLAVFLFILLLIASVAAGTSYYFSQKHKPARALTEYLDAVRSLQISDLSDHLQSSDLTAINETDLLNEKFTDFYSTLSAKMTYQITDSRYSLQSDTASITAHIKYIDASGIYQEAVTSVLSEISSSTQNSQRLSLEDNSVSELLSKQLMANIDLVGLSYTEIDLVYPMILQDDEWKVVSLDKETIRVMCSNVPAMQQSKSLNLPADEASAIIDFDAESYSIQYVNHSFTADLSGDLCLLYYYNYTNTGNMPSSALVDVDLKVYQHGESCAPALPAEDKGINNEIQEVAPGETFLICQAFSLIDDNPVTIHFEEVNGIGDFSVYSQILHPQKTAAAENVSK